MFRTRTVAGVAALLAATVAGCWADEPNPAGAEKTPAEMLVGTWTKTGMDHYKPVWWHSVRKTFRADGTWSLNSNDDWYVFRTERGRGTYELAGTVVRMSGRESPDDPDRVINEVGPDVPLRLKRWEYPITVLTQDTLVLLLVESKVDPPRTLNYRRVR